jgi:hypothetical protein
MIDHLNAGYRELTPTGLGKRNGRYTRNLFTSAGNIERLEIPRDREGEFVTEVFERYKRMTGNVEEAILQRCTSPGSPCARRSRLRRVAEGRMTTLHRAHHPNAIRIRAVPPNPSSSVVDRPRG